MCDYVVKFISFAGKTLEYAMIVRKRDCAQFNLVEHFRPLIAIGNKRSQIGVSTPLAKGHSNEKVRFPTLLSACKNLEARSRR